MPRILLLIILIWVLYVVIKNFIGRSKPHQTPTSNHHEAETIVACHFCGLHVPENESQLVDGLIVCNNPSCHQSG